LRNVAAISETTPTAINPNVPGSGTCVVAMAGALTAIIDRAVTHFRIEVMSLLLVVSGSGAAAACSA
jgi:hypothetical protein